MKKKIVIIGLIIMLSILLSVNVKSYNDYEGNYDDLECHGIENDLPNEKKIKDIGLIESIIIVISFLFSILLSISFIYWFYTQR